MNRVLRFTASWCQPCKMLAKVLEEIDTDKKIEVYDIDEHSSYATEYGIRSVPTMVMLDGNIEVKRVVGFKNKQELESWLNG